LVAYLAMRHAALGRWGGFTPAFLDNPLAHAEAGAFLPGALRVLAEYARLLVFPMSLSADYGYDAVPLPRSLGASALLPGLALVAAVALSAARARRRHSDARPAWLAVAFAATLAIPLHLVAPLPALCAERFLYLPLAMGALFVAALGVTRDAGRRPGAGPRRALGALGVAVILVFAARSAARSLDWRDERSLFESSARAKPGSARAHNALGRALRDAGLRAEAEAEYLRALAIEPAYASALVNLGNLLLERGEIESARARYEAAIASDPGFERARWNLAVLLERVGDIDGAARQYAAIAAADATHFDARLRIAEILAAAGRTAEARRALDEALRLRPDDPRATRLLERLRAAEAPTP
jgi:tetratricopeptide (TPR) repeat protein